MTAVTTTVGSTVHRLSVSYYDALPTSQRMLIIEDEPRDARILEAMLQRGGLSKFTLSHATSIGEAETKLGEDRPDIIILDLELPDATDLEGLIRLKEYSSQIPIIVLTGRDDENLALSALQQGAEDYLTKGNVDRDRLIRSVRYAIERHKTVKQLAGVTHELQHANATLEKLALLDPLTDLLNRRGLQQAVSREIDRVSREAARVLVVLIDLDDFKEMNDRFGHSVGDIVLMEVSRRLKACVRAVDYVARIGGDEFVMLLPRASGNLVAIAERIRLAVASTAIQLSSGVFRPTASLAAMMLNSDMPSIEQILAHA
ncbi:MAG TPA: diguanylate cyclase, partial [Thermoanaerobaculia bacterium]